MLNKLKPPGTQNVRQIEYMKNTTVKLNAAWINREQNERFPQKGRCPTKSQKNHLRQKPTTSSIHQKLSGE